MVESGGIPSLSVTVGGQEVPRDGAVEERTRHTGVAEGDGVKKGNAGGPVARAKRKKGRGIPGFGAVWRGKQGREWGGGGRRSAG
jgi:hypothetical protein